MEPNEISQHPRKSKSKPIVWAVGVSVVVVVGIAILTARQPGVPMSANGAPAVQGANSQTVPQSPNSQATNPNP